MRRGVHLAAVVGAAVLGASAAAAAPQVTQAQLALMPLPKPALGADAMRLPLDRNSGVQTNKDAADDAFGNVTSGELSRLGRITGYNLDYNDAASKALATGRGLIEIETGVELYRDAAAAVRGVAFWRKDARRATALRTPGFSISIAPFTAGGLGQSTYAFVGRIGLKGKRPFFGAQIIFQSDRLLGGVSVSAAEKTRVRPLATSLAAKLKQRIALVLAGKVSGPPVPLPGKAKAGPPPNGLDLSALALKPSDVGRAQVVHQGYRLDTDLNPISEYERELSPAGEFGYLQEEVALFHSPTEASYTFGVLGEGLSSSSFMKTALAGNKSSEIASWQATAVPGIHVGDESRVELAKLGFKNGTGGYAAFVLLRIGSTTEFLIVAAPSAAKIAPASLKKLAALAADRAQKGLKQ